MDTLYGKLYNKYAELKKARGSEFEKLNHVQEEKFFNYATAADEMIHYFKNFTESQHEQIDGLKTELASVNQKNEELVESHHEQIDELKTELASASQKIKELLEKVARLERLEHNVRSSGAVHGEDPVEVGNSNEDKHLYSEKGRDAPANIHQPPCCKKKICSSGSAGTGSVNCVFQYLLGLLADLEISPLAQSNELCVLGHHQSSGYSFSLSLITDSAGEIQFVYRVICLGTLERVAPYWMKEEIIFSTSMCRMFFEQLSRVLKG